MIDDIGDVLDEGELDLSSDDLFQTKTQTANETVKSLVDDLTCGKIKRPEWQRGSAWDVKRQSLLIESVLLDIPLPLIYL
jgi:uncharacterized protein with ParB-like and HNH nuclease domain